MRPAQGPVALRVAAPPTVTELAGQCECRQMAAALTWPDHGPPTQASLVRSIGFDRSERDEVCFRQSNLLSKMAIGDQSTDGGSLRVGSQASGASGRHASMSHHLSLGPSVPVPNNNAIESRDRVTRSSHDRQTAKCRYNESMPGPQLVAGRPLQNVSAGYVPGRRAGGSGTCGLPALETATHMEFHL